nr:hypothetical protein SHINE37_41935 [Rhizobiaceae bacterium]
MCRAGFPEQYPLVGQVLSPRLQGEGRMPLVAMRARAVLRLAHKERRNLSWPGSLRTTVTTR